MASCSARAPKGHTAAPAITDMNSRRLIAARKALGQGIVRLNVGVWGSTPTDPTVGAPHPSRFYPGNCTGSELSKCEPLHTRWPKLRFGILRYFVFISD